MRAFIVLAAIVGFSPSNAQALDNPTWDVSEKTEALTGSKTVSAILESNQPVANMLGYPEKPALVLRCKEGEVVAYVSWPQVLNVDVGGVLGDNTIVSWRLDDQPIRSDLWSMSDDGTAVGMFSKKKALKFISQLVGSKRFAIRLTGQSTQDAEFSLQEVREVAARIAGSCGATIPSQK